jgi:hypothetical protein
MIKAYTMRSLIVTKVAGRRSEAVRKGASAKSQIRELT